jgi:hypothetical protein
MDEEEHSVLSPEALRDDCLVVDQTCS